MARDGKVTRFKCVVCGLVTTGRLPRGPWGAEGDGTAVYPRRHRVNGKPCGGNILESIWVDWPQGKPCHGGLGGSPSVMAER